ncbi:unnamed protein product [Amoebophrya sp. A120]|nr:unnamed protein product [Amoebophrya sp. A120]|eukprot:GSA120T00023826001.1
MPTVRRESDEEIKEWRARLQSTYCYLQKNEIKVKPNRVEFSFVISPAKATPVFSFVSIFFTASARATPGARVLKRAGPLTRVAFGPWHFGGAKIPGKKKKGAAPAVGCRYAKALRSCRRSAEAPWLPVEIFLFSLFTSARASPGARALKIKRWPAPYACNTLVAKLRRRENVGDTPEARKSPRKKERRRPGRKTFAQ